MAVGGAPCLVNRITYTGDLGYEIWMQPAYQRLVYAAIKDAGAEFDIIDFGMRALLAMRLEKNFPTWFRELRPIYGPFEGAMDRFIKMEKNDFIGREAAAGEQAEMANGKGSRLRRVSFLVDAADADVMGDEPIWAKVPTDYGTVEKPHGYGAPRFDEFGKEVRGSTAAQGASAVRGIVDGEWRVVGWITSAAMHTMCRSRWRRDTFQRHWPRTRAPACSKSKFSATAVRPASMSSLPSIRAAKRCAGSRKAHAPRRFAR